MEKDPTGDGDGRSSEALVETESDESTMNQSQGEWPNWDTSRERVIEQVDAFEADLAAIEDGEHAAQIQYAREQQEIVDRIAKNDQKIAAEREMADRITEDLLADRPMSTEERARNVAELVIASTL